jgi:hypothetical protein
MSTKGPARRSHIISASPISSPKPSDSGTVANRMPDRL